MTTAFTFGQIYLRSNSADPGKTLQNVVSDQSTLFGTHQVVLDTSKGSKTGSKTDLFQF